MNVTSPRVRASQLSVRELDRGSWPDFFRLFRSHGGVYGGCWCTYYESGHSAEWRAADPEDRREQKLRRVMAGRSHGLIVYEEAIPVGWCQFGPAPELPRIDRMRRYAPPDRPAKLWRITCFFVDPAHRGRGVARRALEGVVEAVRHRGGGVLEAYPLAEPRGRRPDSAMWQGSVRMFEREGFHRVGRFGSGAFLVRRRVRRPLPRRRESGPGRRRAGLVRGPGSGGRARSPRAGSRSSPRRSR